MPTIFAGVLPFNAVVGDVALVKTLLQLNIHVGVKNKKGKTAEDIGIEKRHQAVVTAIDDYINIARPPL